MEVVESISFSDIKLGQFIQIENDDKTYVVVQHGQMYHLMPVALDKQVVVGFYDVKKPRILKLFDKNGNCIKNVRIEV